MTLYLVLSDKELYLYSRDAKHVQLVQKIGLSNNTNIELRNKLSVLKEKKYVLLLDRSEEEFHLDQLPDIPYRQQTELLKNRCNSYFDDTHRSSIAIETKKQKNSQRRVLYFGIKSSGVIEEIVSVLNEQGIGLLGIYSVCPLAIHQEYQSSGDIFLHISSQDEKQWRYSFYEDDFLLMSRSVEYNADSLQKFILVELKLTCKYAASKKIIQTNRRIKIVVQGKIAFSSSDIDGIQADLFVSETKLLTDDKPIYKGIVRRFNYLTHKKFNYANRYELKTIRYWSLSKGAFVGSMIICIVSIIYILNLYPMIKTDQEVSNQTLLNIENSKKLLIRLEEEKKEHSISLSNMQRSIAAFENITTDVYLNKFISKLAYALEELPELELNSFAWYQTDTNRYSDSIYSPQEKSNIVEPVSNVLIGEFTTRNQQGVAQLKRKLLLKLKRYGVEEIASKSEQQPSVFNRGAFQKVIDHSQVGSKKFRIRLHLIEAP